MKRIFLVSYGGGHANIMRYVYQELKNREDIEIILLALTTAPLLYMRCNITDYTTISETAKCLPYYETILALGKKYGVQYHNDETGIPLEDTIVYYGLGMFDLIKEHGEEKAQELLHEKGRKVFSPVFSMTNILKYYQPDVCVITASPRVERATGIAANSLGIPVVRINDLPITEHIDHDCYLCVMNEWAKKNAISRSGIPQEKIIVTGQPAFEGNSIIDPAIMDDILCRINHKNFKKTVVFFAQNGKNQEDELRILYEIAESMPEVLYVIKLHPNQLQSEIPESRLKNVVCCKDEAKYFFRIADAVITTFSTTGMEAAMFDIPVIVINFSSQQYPMDYEKMGIALTARDKAELAELIEVMLDKESEVYSSLCRSRSGFSLEECASANIVKVIMNS